MDRSLQLLKVFERGHFEVCWLCLGYRLIREVLEHVAATVINASQ